MKNQNINSLTKEDTILWREMKEGNEKSFSALFERYYGYLNHYGNTLCLHPEKVQDSVQDVFTDIWIYRQSLNDSVVVKAYLLSCIRKRLARQNERDHVFRKTTSTDTIEFLFDFSIEHQLIIDEVTAEKVVHLNKLLNELPDRQKEALYLRYHQGLTIEQIAEMLEVNYQSANNLLHRALINLRKEWKENLTLIMLTPLFLNLLEKN